MKEQEPLGITLRGTGDLNMKFPKRNIQQIFIFCGEMIKYFLNLILLDYKY